MKLLLDTHCWLWALAEPERLSSAARDLLVDRTNHVYLSIASLWEVTIKTALGKLDLAAGLREIVDLSLRDLGVRLLPIELPHLERHPFDRMLVAQAQAEDLALVTADTALTDSLGIELIRAT